MKRELRQQWIDALRSGKFQQGRAVLFRDNAYCCIGVLGSVCGVSNDKLYEFRGNLSSNGTNGALAPIDELSFAEARTLADLNDGINDEKRCYTFAEIADYIEANIPVDA